MPKKFKPNKDYSRRGGKRQLIKDIEAHNLKEYGTTAPYKKSISEHLGLTESKIPGKGSTIKKKKNKDKLKIQ